MNSTHLILIAVVNEAVFIFGLSGASMFMVSMYVASMRVKSLSGRGGSHWCLNNVAHWFFLAFSMESTLYRFGLSFFEVLVASSTG
jgi:hypothetical protein